MPPTSRSVLRLTSALLAAASIAACAHAPPPPAPTASTPSAPYAPPPPTAAAPTGPVSSGPSGPAAGSEQDFVINVGDRIYFDTDGFDVRPDAAQTLGRQAEWLQRYPSVAVRIEGNCDERGTREFNFALGARRADAVKTFLVAHGVNPGRITTISYGKEHPIDAGSGEEAWAHNRNAHTALVSGGAQ